MSPESHSPIWYQTTGNRHDMFQRDGVHIDTSNSRYLVGTIYSLWPVMQ